MTDPESKWEVGLLRVRAIRLSVQQRLDALSPDDPLVRLALTAQLQILDAVILNLTSLDN